MKARTYRDLLIWQKAMRLTQAIYRVTSDFPKQEIYGLTSQMRRAAVSIPSNIAEGHGRGSDRSFALFLTQSRGSLYELETQVRIAASLHYLTLEEAAKIEHSTQEIARMINALLRTVRTGELTKRTEK
jgi:four helix bundle protein